MSLFNKEEEKKIAVDLEIKNILEMQSQRLDNQEAMIASLTMAYVEMFTAVDLIVKTTVADYSNEEKESFLKQYDKFRMDVLQSIQEVSRNGIEGLSPDVTRTMEDVVSANEDS